jgi:hypothetical protein
MPITSTRLSSKSWRLEGLEMPAERSQGGRKCQLPSHTAELEDESSLKEQITTDDSSEVEGERERALLWI